MYHAYEGNEYNILLCDNYGSIYTKYGEDAGDRVGANDSAGILGNITTYNVSSRDRQQPFMFEFWAVTMHLE